MLGTTVALLESSRERRGDFLEETSMLWTLAIVLFVLWLLGGVVFHVGGGLIHLLLVIALVVLVVQLVTGRRTVV